MNIDDAFHVIRRLRKRLRRWTGTYEKLAFILECKWPHNPVWETIAAFDGKGVAVSYAWDVIHRDLDSPLRYRVVNRKGDVLWEQPDQKS